MVTDIDIHRSAWTLIRLYGAEAPKMAAMRAATLANDGDAEGAAVFRQVTMTILEIAREKRPDERAH